MNERVKGEMKNGISDGITCLKSIEINTCLYANSYRIFILSLFQKRLPSYFLMIKKNFMTGIIKEKRG